MTTQIHIIPILRDNYAYIIEGDNRRCLIIDPGQVAPIEHFVELRQLSPILILNTHHHADHIAGNASLKSKYGTPVLGPKVEADKIPTLDTGLEEGDKVEELGLDLHVISTPGHTAGHIVFYAPSLQALFSGDTLFSLGCGRLFEGSAQNMFESLGKIKSLPTGTLIYCGHEYTETNGAFALSVDPDNIDLKKRLEGVRKLRSNDLPSIPVTLEVELKTNPFLRAQTPELFAELRKRKDSF